MTRFKESYKPFEKFVWACLIIGLTVNLVIAIMVSLGMFKHPKRNTNTPPIVAEQPTDFAISPRVSASPREEGR